MADRSGRLVRRVSLTFPVTIESADQTPHTEFTFTENVSPLGMQVLTKRSWQSEREMVISVDQAGRRRARAVYCIPREDGRFTVGVSLSGPPVNWKALFPHLAAD